jgi:hypothetical protein
LTNIEISEVLFTSLNEAILNRMGVRFASPVVQQKQNVLSNKKIYKEGVLLII